MTKYFFNILLALIPLFGFAQIVPPTFYVSGTITDFNGNPVANKAVTIYSDSAFQTQYNATVVTQSNGYYADTFAYPLLQGNIYVATTNCNGVPIVGFQPFTTTQGASVYINKDFQICAGGSQCQAGFTYTLQGNSITATNTSAIGPFGGMNVIWSLFGTNVSDTSYQSYVTTFSNIPPGVYNLCLMVEDTINQCADTHCETIQIGLTCSGQFSYALSPQTVSITNLSQPSAGQNSFYSFWELTGLNFYDTSTVQSPVFTNLADGHYNLCLNISDSSGCTSYVCDSFYISSGINCNADFAMPLSPFSNCNFIFNLLQPSTFNNVLVDFGDGTTAQYYNQNLPHGYPIAGSYTVTCKIFDSFGGVCDSSSQTIVSQGCNTTGCNADFVANTLNPSNFCEWTFDLLSMGNASSISWNFGDGTTISGNTAPTHTYTTSGLQMVICTLFDSLGNVCDTSMLAIVVQSCGNNGFYIDGTVTKPTSSGSLLADAEVYLIEFDPSLGTLTAIATDQTDSVGVYSFGNLPANNYLLKAALKPSDPDYGNFMPTYYGSVLMWNQATTVNATASNVNISLLAGVTYSGPGFVGGYVSQGANRISGVGDPLPDHLVLLTTAADQPMDFDFTDANGQYSFSGLPYGTYKLWVDVLNSVCDPLIVSLTPGSSAINDADFEVNSTYVTGIMHPSLASDFEVYPNPAQDKLFIDIKDNAQANVSVQITDILGKVHIEAAISAPSNEISLQSLPSGYYFLVVKTENGSFVQKIVKQ